MCVKNFHRRECLAVPQGEAAQYVPTPSAEGATAGRGVKGRVVKIQYQHQLNYSGNQSAFSLGGSHEKFAKSKTN